MPKCQSQGLTEVVLFVSIGHRSCFLCIYNTKMLWGSPVIVLLGRLRIPSVHGNTWPWVESRTEVTNKSLHGEKRVVTHTRKTHLAFVIPEEESKIIDALKSLNISTSSNMTCLCQQATRVCKLYEHMNVSCGFDSYIIFSWLHFIICNMRIVYLEQYIC